MAGDFFVLTLSRNHRILPFLRVLISGKVVSTLRIKLHRQPAMEVGRVSIGDNRLVYLVVCEKALRYRWGKSRIAYIGTTRKGIKRISQSVAARADDILSLHGVRRFHVRVVVCGPRRNVKTWVKLERALLLTFRQMYGDLPKCNISGKRMKSTDEAAYFKRERLEKILTLVG